VLEPLILRERDRTGVGLTLQLPRGILDVGLHLVLNSLADGHQRPGSLRVVVHEDVVALLRVLPEIEYLRHSGDVLLGALPTQIAVHGEASRRLTVVAAHIEDGLVIAHGKPAGNNWNRSQHNAEWGFDFYNRVSTSRSNIFDNRPSETQYFYTDNDASGEALDGSNTYRITFPKGQQPPVKGFWSLTLYDETHFFYDNALKRYSLGTKNDTLQLNEDGSLTLYAGNESPGKDKETNWLPAPEGPFSLYIRAYWGEASILDGSWQPPAVKKVEP